MGSHKKYDFVKKALDQVIAFVIVVFVMLNDVKVMQLRFKSSVYQTGVCL